MSNKPTIVDPEARRVARIERIHNAAMLDLGFFAILAYQVAFTATNPVLFAVLGVIGLIQTIRAALGLDPFRWWKN